MHVPLRFYPITILWLIVLLPATGCREEFEPTPCDGGGVLLRLPDMEGTHIYCRLYDTVAHGDYTFLDKTGATVITGRFEQGVAQGDWTWWFDGGAVLKQTGAFEQGMPTGLWVGYDEVGGLRWEHEFLAGIGCGLWRDYDELGDLETEIAYAPCDGTSGISTPEGLVMAPQFPQDIWNGATCTPPYHLSQAPEDPQTYWCEEALGQKHGNYRRNFPDSLDDELGKVPQVVGQYDSGQRVGVWTHFNQFREVVAQGEYQADERQGPWHFWRAGGMPMEVGEYDQGLRSGTWQGYFGNGLPQWRGSYAQDRRDGAWQEWWPTGQVRTNSNYQAGERDGDYEAFFESGGPAESGQYANDRQVGDWEGYWNNGNLSYQGSYVDGFRHGSWTWFDRHGDMEAAGNYVMQNPMGDFTIRVEDTATGLILVGVGPFDYGVRHGIWTFTWEEAGTLESEILYLDDLREGPWTSYWPDQSVRIEGYFLTGVGQFTWHYYYPNGQMSAEETLHEGERNGPFTSWYENGQMKSQGGYVTDKKSGVWTYWDENGNVTHTEEYSEWGGPK